MNKIIILSCLFLTSTIMANPIAVIAPMTSESTYLKTRMQDLKKHDRHDMRYFTGEIGEHHIVLISPWRLISPQTH